MNASFWQRGETLDYTATEAVKSGAVVKLSTRIGVAGTDMAVGECGPIHVVGVFRMDKASGEAIPMGAAVYYDVINDVITASAADNVPAGYAAASTSTADGSVYVKLLG